MSCVLKRHVKDGMKVRKTYEYLYEYLCKFLMNFSNFLRFEQHGRVTRIIIAGEGCFLMYFDAFQDVIYKLDTENQVEEALFLFNLIVFRRTQVSSEGVRRADSGSEGVHGHDQTVLRGTAAPGG